MNIVFHADLSKYVAHRPSVLYWVHAAGRRHRRHRHGPGAHGAPVERVADRLGLRHQRAAARGRRGGRDPVVHNLVGDDTIDVTLRSTSLWGNNKMYATRYVEGRVFCMGDACHRHPPSNGLGSNTSIAGRLQPGLEARAGARRPGRAVAAGLLRRRARADRRADRRCAPTSRIEEFGPIFEALGLLDRPTPSRCGPTWRPARTTRRAAPRRGPS